MNLAIAETTSTDKIKTVDHAFVASLDGHEVLFLKAQGVGALAYRLPEGFIGRLKAGTQPSALFPLGKTLMTPGAIDALNDSQQSPNEFLSNHKTGNWGVVDELDWKENDYSVSSGHRIFSAYLTSKGVKLWVITEADRKSTTILLPNEY